MVEITFATKGREFFEGLLISSIKRIFPRIGSLAFPLILLIGLYGVLQISGKVESLPVYAAILIALVLAALALVPALRALQSSRNPQRAASATWRISEKRMEILTGRGQAKVEWKTFVRPVETWHLFLLHSAADSQTIYILPKRAFRDDAQRERFREIVKKIYGKFF
jgi:hypothetical protein